MERSLDKKRQYYKDVISVQINLETEHKANKNIKVF